MIDTESLRTASTYINNQLLSRGLLRDGQTIDFAEPSSQDGDASATMGRIISVVNDLILRRDRDAEHRESLSVSMRGLKADNLKAATDLGKLSERHADAQRKLNIAESGESLLKTQLKSAETAAKVLKEEVARTKALVAQTRALCATDVRRRDRQIDTMKKQLGEAGRARGSSRTPGITSIIVTPSGRVDAGAASGVENCGPADEGAYSLRSETNAFLATLAQNLSEENEALLELMRRTMGQLRTMSGFSPETESDPEVTKEPGVEELTGDLESVMAHMRTILTNPSFVPIEEVEVRDEEINRLKDGWVKMEDRWRDAVLLIDGWRKRMATNGKPIGEDEFQLGLRLSPVRVKGVKETRDAIVGRSLTAVAEADSADEAMPPASPGASDSVEAEVQSKDLNDERQPKRHKGMSKQVESQGAAKRSRDTSGSRQKESPPLPEPPKPSPLKNSATAGNRGSARGQVAGSKLASLRARQGEKKAEVAPLKKPATRPARSLPVPRQPSTQRPVPKAGPETEAERPKSPLRTAPVDASVPKKEAEPMEIDEPVVEEDERHTREGPADDMSDHSDSEEAEPAQQQSPLTMKNIAAKLAASEREADAARVRAKLRAAARGTGGVKRPTPAKPRTMPQGDLPEEDGDELAGSLPVGEDMDPVKHDVVGKPGKRKRDRGSLAVGKGSRRRSTLSPWELESLISGGGQ